MTDQHTYTGNEVYPILVSDIAAIPACGYVHYSWIKQTTIRDGVCTCVSQLDWLASLTGGFGLLSLESITNAWRDRLSDWLRWDGYQIT